MEQITIEPEDLDLINLEQFQKFDEISSQITVPLFTASDLGEEITNRKLNIWFNENLLMTQREKGQWRKLNFVEYCWVKVIDQLRDFNISYDIIRGLKAELIHSVDWMVIAEMPELLNKLLEMIPENEREEAKKVIINREYRKEDANELGLSLFLLLIMDCLVKQDHLAIAVNKQGEFLVIKNSCLHKLLRSEEFTRFYQSSYVCISMTDIISSYIKEFSIKDSRKSLDLLTKEEKAVLESLRKKNLKSVTIHFDAGHQIELIETTKVQKVDPAARLVDLIMANSYQTITIKTHKGKIVHCENTRKEKLNEDKGTSKGKTKR